MRFTRRFALPLGSTSEHTRTETKGAQESNGKGRDGHHWRRMNNRQETKVVKTMLCQRFFRKAIFVVLTSFIATIVGCSGGGKNNPIPPSPPSSPSNNSQENPIVSINASPREVNSGNEVFLEIAIQNGVPINIEWAQSPNQPAGQFQKVDSSRWTWKAPSVSARTTFILTATVTFLTTTRQTSITITVLPSSQPPQPNPNPPVIQIVYPWEDNRVNVVGDNVILTVKGYVYSRSNGYVNKVEAYIDNEKVAETIPDYDYFELDITRFGNNQGNKQVIIKATTTDNAIGEYRLNIIYDNNLLYSLAVEFIRRYSCIYHEDEGKYRIVRFGNLNNGPYNRPVRVYVWEGLWQYKHYIEQACGFWTKYTGIQFQIILQNPTGEEPVPVIGIREYFDKDPGIGAEARPGWQNDQHEITSGGIALYRRWLSYSDTTKWIAIAHEIGHIIFTLGMGIDGEGHTNEGDIMDYRGPTKPLIHSYQQVAIKIQYSKNPGESI